MSAASKMTGARTTDPGKPIFLTSSKDSRERVVTGLLAFQRWARDQDRDVPPALSQGLQEHGLELDIANLHLDDVFHLVKQARHDSSIAVQIFEFTAGVKGNTAGGNTTVNKNTLLVKWVKKSDSDRHTLNVQTGEVCSIHGHWMAGDTEHSYSFDMPVDVPDARTFLLEHSMNPRKWLNERRFAVIRPTDLPSDLDDSSLPLANGVALCPEAVVYLQKGFTLLLVKGDLIQVHLPTNAHRRKPMLIAGLMFKEGESQQSRISPLWRRDELSFIIAERAQRRRGFTGIHADATEPGLRFRGGMYEWNDEDVYKYAAGQWDTSGFVPPAAWNLR